MEFGSYEAGEDLGKGGEGKYDQNIVYNFLKFTQPFL